MAKRHLKRMRMTKIDMVDKPAQEHAVTTITKRNEGGLDMTPEEIKKIAAEVAELMTKGKEPTEDEIAKAFAETEDTMLEALDEDEAEIYKSLPDEEQQETLMAFAEDPDQFLDELDLADAHIAKAAEEDAMEMEGLSDLNPEDKAELFDQMMEEEQMLEAGAEVKKGLDDELAKSNQRIEELEAQINFAKAAAKVNEKFPHLPGEEAEKVAMYMGVRQLPTQQQEAVLKALTAGDEALKAFQIEEGVSTSASDMGKNAADVLDAKANELAKSADITPAEAYQRILSTEDGAKLYATYRDDTRSLN